MAHDFGTLLMFEGKAEEAMTFYVSLFKNAKIDDIQRYGPGEMGTEGSIKVASFTLGTQRMSCIDSPMKHHFTFTPSISIVVDCDDEAELDSVFEQLSANGQVLMPAANYGFSRRFGWVSDRFGVSWQLSLK
jgi:predicted 3-demethylubiquinone-9 3-methyltransferase (glyoxalase superfamily)